MEFTENADAKWTWESAFFDVLWNGEHMKESCNCQKIERNEAQATDTRVLIEKIQASLMFLIEEKEIPEPCHIKSPRSMENHLVISIEQKHILKRSARKNPQFIYFQSEGV